MEDHGLPGVQEPSSELKIGSMSPYTGTNVRNKEEKDDEFWTETAS